MPPSGGIFFASGSGFGIRDNSGRGSGFGSHTIKHNRLCVGAPTNIMSRISAAIKSKIFKFNKIKKFKSALFMSYFLCSLKTT